MRTISRRAGTGEGGAWNEIVTLLFDGRVVNEYNPDVPESHAVFEITLEKGCERVLWPVPLYLIGPRQIRISDLEYQLNQREDIRSVHFLGWYNRVVITQDANFPFQEVLK